MPDEKPPLTDEQIRLLFKQITTQFISYGREVAALRRALLQKGILTESEMSEATNRVHREGAEQLQKMASDLRSKPPKGVQ